MEFYKGLEMYLKGVHEDLSVLDWLGEEWNVIGECFIYLFILNEVLNISHGSPFLERHKS